MENRPSKKQRELLSFIDGFIKGNGYGPSYREVMRALDYKSVSTVAIHINGLIAKGYLVKKDNSARSLAVVGQVDASPIAQPNSATVPLKKKFLELAKLDATSADLDTLVEAIRILDDADTADELRQQLADLRNKQ